LVHALAALNDDLNRIAPSPPPSLAVYVEGRPREIRPLVRDEIYRIARAALRNAFMHSQGSKDECEVDFGDRLLRVRVCDDGEGLEKGILEAGVRPGHWGLPSMRERAEAIGGKFELWSASSKGTEVKLTIAAATAYQNR